jgi:hypothetical protein
MSEMSVYRIYTNECINIIMSLRDIFPLELIQVIIRLYWSLHSHPVLLSIMLRSNGTPSFNPMHVKSSESNVSVLRKILETNPNLRHYSVYSSSLNISTGAKRL